MSRRTVQVLWFLAIMTWAVSCGVAWFVATRDHYKRLNAGRACYDTSLRSQNTKPQCANTKFSVIAVYKAAIDRKARISRVTAGLGAAAALALWFILGRPGLRPYR
jgi:hypothetical protein